MAYAALVNLEKSIVQILPNERHYLFLCDKQQMQSLHDRVILFQEFLGDISRKSRLSEIDQLESRIRDVSYRLEDIIESILVQSLADHESETEASSDDILGWCLDQDCENKANYSHLPVTVRAAAAFGNCVKQVDLLLEEAMEMKKILDNNVMPGNSIYSHNTTTTGLPAGATDTKVGLDDPLTQILLQVTGRPPMFQVVPITGMGGIGKTTLARAVFEDPRTVNHFDVRLWATVSQEYNVMDILQGLLEKEEQKEQVLGKLIVRVHQRLRGRRYLIILDDVWDEKVWDGVRNAFPDDNNYSRVVLTTRLSKVASYVNTSRHVHQMQLLNEEQSWDLLRETVYGHEAGCPSDVEDIGRTISRNCKGLPLALVVIGGLLKFNKVRDYWQEVAVSTTEVAANDEHVLGIMSLSYKNLPPHLKACFLYFGMFPEDQEVPTKKLVRLWAAEGFLKPRETKTMEEVAEESLVELVERNLVMGKMKKYSGKIKTSSVHDVLRDLSLRQAQKEKLLYNHESAKMDEVSLLRIINNQRRVSFPRCNFCNISYSSLVRTFRTPEISTSTVQHFKLVRVLDKVLLSPDLIIFFRLTNLRYLHLETYWELNDATIMVPESISKLRYLETFVIKDNYVDRYQLVFPVQIWEMPGLQHIDSQANVLLPPFPASDLNDSSIESFSLQTLRRVVNFDFTPSVVERIQNLKTLEIKFRTKKDGQFYLGALACLMHLEKLSIHRDPDGPQVTDVAFPDKLKELTLHGTRIPVENISSDIGSLPNLESLKLEEDSVLGDVWEPVDGEFLQLKQLEMTYS